MYIVMITGSPHRHGTSALLADEFIRGATESGTLFFASMLLLNVCIPVSVVIPVGVEKSHACFKTA